MRWRSALPRRVPPTCSLECSVIGSAPPAGGRTLVSTNSLALPSPADPRRRRCRRRQSPALVRMWGSASSAHRARAAHVFHRRRGAHRRASPRSRAGRSRGPKLAQGQYSSGAPVGARAALSRHNAPPGADGAEACARRVARRGSAPGSSTESGGRGALGRREAGRDGLGGANGGQLSRGCRRWPPEGRSAGFGPEHGR